MSHIHQLLSDSKIKKEAQMLDLCVPLVFAKTGELKIYREIYLKLPSIFCDVKCEDIQITKRSISLDSNNVAVSIDYIIGYKFLPFYGERLNQNFKSSFTKIIPIKHFKQKGRSIYIKDLIAADGACVFIKDINVKSNSLKISSKKQQSTITSVVKFIIEVKLFKNYNIYVPGIKDRWAEPLSLQYSPCELTNN